MRLVPLALALAFVGCTPRIPEGLACTVDGDCPPGQTCALSGTCHIAGTDAGTMPDGGRDASVDGDVDAAAPDAPPADTGLDAPTPTDDTGPMPVLSFGTETTTGPLPSDLGSVIAFLSAELGSDNVDDFVIGGTSHAYVYRSTAALAYDSPASYASMGMGLDWTLTDVEPDGSLDLWCMSDPSSARVFTFINTGTAFDGSLGTALFSLGPNRHALTVSDVNGDTTPDIVVSGATGVQATARGSGGSLGTIISGATNDTLVLHGNGDPHLFVRASAVRYFVYHGVGTATQIGAFPPSGDLAAPRDAVLYDYDGDADDDVVLLRGAGAADEIVVLTQEDGDVLTIAARFDVAPGTTGVAVAELVGGGTPELVVSRSAGGATDVASVYDVAGTELVQLPTGSRVGVVTGSYDGMGALDVAFVGADGALDIWINQTTP